jgi:hypothetical protein
VREHTDLQRYQVDLSPSSNPLLLLVVGYALQVLQRWSIWLLRVGEVVAAAMRAVAAEAVAAQVVLELRQDLQFPLELLTPSP